MCYVHTCTMYENTMHVIKYLIKLNIFLILMYFWYALRKCTERIFLYNSLNYLSAEQILLSVEKMLPQPMQDWKILHRRNRHTQVSVLSI